MTQTVFEKKYGEVPKEVVELTSSLCLKLQNINKELRKLNIPIQCATIITEHRKEYWARNTNIYFEKATKRINYDSNMDNLDYI